MVIIESVWRRLNEQAGSEETPAGDVPERGKPATQPSHERALRTHKSQTRTLARFYLRPTPSRQNLTQVQQNSGSKLQKGPSMARRIFASK